MVVNSEDTVKFAFYHDSDAAAPFQEYETDSDYQNGQSYTKIIE